MPELPEVETVRSGLEKLIVGKTIENITHDWEKSFPNDPVVVSEFAIGSKITAVKRRAKVLLIELESKYTLMTHLKMTGQLVYVNNGYSEDSFEQNSGAKVSIGANHIDYTKKREAESSSRKAVKSQAVQSTRSTGLLGDESRWGAGHPNDSLISKLPDKSTRVTIDFKDNSNLFFNDQRKFGWMKLLPNELVSEEPFMKKVGPEPLETSFTDKLFIERVLRRKNSNIKATLLDQTVLAGVGNIYADESLWGARIHPATLVKDISKKKLSILHHELLYVLRLSIEKGGSTDRNYVNAEGKRGSYIDFARVFRKENQPCSRCKTVIEKTRVAGRGTHFCPTCQKR